MAKGTCKWFQDAKGYGFLKDDYGEEFFCHHSAIQMPGFKTLKTGQRVEFDVVKDSKGFRAANVRPIQDGNN